jgi:hypothetical protein
MRFRYIPSGSEIQLMTSDDHEFVGIPCILFAVLYTGSPLPGVVNCKEQSSQRKCLVTRTQDKKIITNKFSGNLTKLRYSEMIVTKKLNTSKFGNTEYFVFTSPIENIKMKTCKIIISPGFASLQVNYYKDGDFTTL